MPESVRNFREYDRATAGCAAEEHIADRERRLPMQCVILVLPVEAKMECSHRHICRAFQSKPALAVDDCRRDWDVYGLVSANHNFRVPMDACTLLGKQERNVRRYGSSSKWVEPYLRRG